MCKCILFYSSVYTRKHSGHDPQNNFCLLIIFVDPPLENQVSGRVFG